MNFEIQDDVAVLHFDDGKANVVNHAFIDDMEAGLERALKEAKAVVITGRPGKFSAGFDLSEFQKGPEAATKLVNRGGAMLLKVFSHPQPVVAACTGHAIAAGCFLLLASDVRLGIDGPFKLGANETAIGMALPKFALELIEYRVPRNLIDTTVLQARLFSPQAAIAPGILDEVVPAEALMGSALVMAKQLGAYSNQAYVANQLALRQAYIDRIAASLTV